MSKLCKDKFKDKFRVLKEYIRECLLIINKSKGMHKTILKDWIRNTKWQETLWPNVKCRAKRKLSMKFNESKLNMKMFFMS